MINGKAIFFKVAFLLITKSESRQCYQHSRLSSYPPTILGELMKDILTAISAFFAFNKISKMLTDPIRSVPFDWIVIRLTIVAVALTSFAMFFVYALDFMVKHWPF